LRATIHVVDDDEMFRNALQSVLELAGHDVQTYASAGEFLLAEPPPHGPGCIILDLQMPGPSGLELHEALARRTGALPVIFLTGFGDVSSTVRAMKAGAVDFLTKPVDRVTLLSAVQTALAHGEEWRAAAERRLDLERRFSSLTRREAAIFEHIVAGRLNKQIAGELDIAERTVKTYRAQVMEKMGARSIAELAALAAELRSSNSHR
jgi:FixJ family two-component response regulator